METTLLQQFPQYAALILSAVGFAWYLKYAAAREEARETRYRAEGDARNARHREERVEWMDALRGEQATWRAFIAEQNQVWLSNINGIVARFREALAEDRKENLDELRKLGEAIATHDSHAQDVAQRVAEVLAGKLVETAKASGNGPREAPRT
jgi:hypothetical protein